MGPTRGCWGLSSLHQLYLLLWRNTLIRWRGGSVTVFRTVTLPLFQLIEMLWPLLLYFTVVILRNQFPTEKVPDLRFRPYAMPSAGLIPFLQTLICDLDLDTGRENDEFSDMPIFPNATVNELYGMFDEVGEWKASWNGVCNTLHKLSDMAKCFNDGCLQDRDAVPLTCYLKNPAEFEDYLNRNLSLSQSIVDGIIGATLNITEVSERPAEFVDISSLLQILGFNSDQAFICSDNQQLFSLIHFSDVSAEDVQNDLCNLSAAQWQDFSQELEKQVVVECDLSEVTKGVSQVLALQQLLRETDVMNLFNGLDEVEDYGSESDQDLAANDCSTETEKYVQYFCGSSRKVASPVFQLVLKRGCSGDAYKQASAERNRDGNTTASGVSNKHSLKILYTPHNNMTASIIKKANRTVDTILQLNALAEEVANCSQFFLDNFPSNSIELLENISMLNSSRLPNNISLDDLRAAQNLLNDSTSNNVWSVMMMIHTVSESVVSSLNQFDWDVFMPLEDEKALEELAGDYQKQDEMGINYVVAGIVFDSNLPTSSAVKFKNTTIKIRTNFSSVLDSSKYRETVWFPGPENIPWKKRYIDGFFVFVQDMMERAVLEEILGIRVSSPGVYLQQMPYPCYKFDVLTAYLLYMLPIGMVIAWLFPVAMTTRAVVSEKQMRLKEFMKMMGVGEGLLRLSWFLSSMAVFSVSVVGITLLLKVGEVFPATSWLILLLYLTLYAVVMLSYSFLVSVFFDNANLAACVASLIYFLVFFAYVSITANMNSLSPLTFGVCCLFAPLAFSLGATYFVQWELMQEGVQWNNIATTPIEDDPLSILTISYIMAFDAMLYLVLTWYIEGVFPGRYGVGKPWYFPFMPSYWCGKRQWSNLTWFRGNTRARHVPLLEEDGEEMAVMSPPNKEEDSSSENYEEEPRGLPLGITIKNLSKRFLIGMVPCRRRQILAVNNLSFNLYEGQITIFLGHNGAGKTTTMSVLTGLLEPSSGTAHIYGNSIGRHMDIIRQSLGFCPQHNILFDNLTVEEHLLFYGQLKGLSRSEARHQASIWLQKFNLCSHKNKLSKHLSGGMKRKLSILMAFVGKCKTIILDEPTAGVDPFARRQILDFLLKHREGRTIMLSTHHMDEAEILGDRIAIISNGSLLCCGSFEYLKHHFGRGHRLTLVTKTQSERRPSIFSRTFTVTADVNENDSEVDNLVSPSNVVLPDKQLSDSFESKITSFLQEIMGGVTTIERRGRELHYLLPMKEAHPNTLVRLFSELEEQKDNLGVVSYGMTACSMEEVFFQLTEQELMEKTEANESRDAYAPRPSLRSVNSNVSLDVDGLVAHTSTEGDICDNEGDEEDLLFDDESPLGSDFLGTNSRLVNIQLWLVQFYALLVKRFHYTKGNVVVVLGVQNLLPMLVICLCLLISRFLEDVPDPPALELSPHLFFAKSDDNYLFAGGYYTNETSPMVDSLFHSCGVGANNLGFTRRDRALECYRDIPSAECSVHDYPQKQYKCTCDASCDIQTQTSQNATETIISFSHHIPPCYNGTVSGSRILNLTMSYDPSEPDLAYLSLHHYLLRSTSSFIEERYGGLSFGHFKKDVSEEVDQLNDNKTFQLPFLATHSAAKAWYSLKGYHAMPAYLNTMNNAILRGTAQGSQLTEYGIRTFSHPFKMTKLEKLLYAVTENLSFLVIPLGTVFSLGFVVAGFVLILIEERSRNVKHLQLVSGMNRTVYWLNAYVWDLMWFLTFAVLMAILFLVFRDAFYSGSEEFPLFFLLLLCYGIAVTPWMYMLSFLFKSPSTAYVFLSCLNFISGFLFLFVELILILMKINGSESLLHYTLIWIPFPAYFLGRSMMYFSLDRPVIRYVATWTSNPIPSPYSQLAPFMISLLVQSCIYTAVIIFIEATPFITNRINHRKKKSLTLPTGEDEAVISERRKVLRSDSTKELLVFRNLTKVYGHRCNSQNRLAVNQLCLKMQKAECFGLLGVNGAGKTTTFRMLTGDTRITSGEAYIGSDRVSWGSRNKVQQSVGYCPQVDAFLDPLTGREHLTLFCRLRGLPSSEVKKAVEWALIKLRLKEYADKPVGTYSGGNRRKLSTALALLAQPSLILLDEPTSGVDPSARQFLWTVVRRLVEAGQSVLLTTHSMAECEALCSRVGIMVNGSFRCLGSPQQLKLAYGQGYKLKIRVTGQTDALKEFIQQSFATSILKEEHYNTLVYQLPSVGLHLPEIYQTMESACLSLKIKDYSLSQTTLDDVFIHFANEQSEDAGLEMLPQ